MVPQKPNLKKAAKPQTLLQQAQDYGQQLVQQLFGLTAGWQRQRDIVQNNYNLGLRHFKLGNIDDAILRFKFATWLDASHPDAWYYLGRSYLAAGKQSLALSALTKARKLRPAHEETQYMLAVAAGKSATDLPLKMPLSLSLEHFESIAPDFTREQLEQYGYRGHTLLDAAIRAALTPGRMDHMILDLGAGTGLCGSGLRDIASEITGVDMSGNMLAQALKLKDAAGKKTYDALIQREVHDYLNSAPEAGFDIVLAAGLMGYIGDIQPLFHLATRALKPGGLFAFTADILQGTGYRFEPEAGRFLFSQPYLRQLASENTLTEIRFEEAMAYSGYKMWVCVFRK